MSDYANSFDDLRGDIMGVLTSMTDTFAAQRKLDEALFAEIDRLWRDNATLRDDLHALANRLEALTNFVVTDPAEVAEKMMPPVTIVKANLEGGDRE
jgi:hypothetical protein